MLRTSTTLAALTLTLSLATAGTSLAGHPSSHGWAMTVCETPVATAVPTATRVVETETVVQSAPTIVKQVQRTEKYRIKRPEVVSGCGLTLFANYLEEKPGTVDLVIDGVTHCCKIDEWRNQAVSFTLPMLGLESPRNARIRITRPDGRIAKSVNAVLLPQPTVVVHQETLGQPTPAGATDEAPSYAGDNSQG